MSMDDLLLISEVFRFPQRKHLWQMKLLKPRIYLLNWQKREIMEKLAAPPAYFDDREYKFLRLCYHYNGARGITSNSNTIFVALQNVILLYDNRLKECKGRIHHPLFNGIHEIVWHNHRLYVTCAVTDTILVMSEEGEELEKFNLGDRAYFLEQFKLPVRHLDCRLDYRIMHQIKRLYHINNVQVIGDNVYANFNMRGSFVKIHPNEEIIIRDQNLVQSHNAQFSPCGKYILINDTANYTLRVYDATGKPMHSMDLREFPLPVDFSQFMVFDKGHPIKAGWLRGMAFSHRDESVVFVGLSPSMVVALDYLEKKFIDYVRFRRNIWISIHGIHNVSQNYNANQRGEPIEK